MIETMQSHTPPPHAKHTNNTGAVWYDIECTDTISGVFTIFTSITRLPICVSEHAGFIFTNKKITQLRFLQFGCSSIFLEIKTVYFNVHFLGNLCVLFQ